jgi:hypothetical protein
MRRHTVGLCAAAVAVAVALVGCGEQSGVQAGGGSPSGPAATSSSTPPPTTPATTLPGPTGSASPPVGTPSGPTLLLDGVASPGVEPGCVVFAADGGRRYLLQGATGKVPTGVPIRVRGVVLTGVFSYCQQGTPLKVEEITRR